MPRTSLGLILTLAFATGCSGGGATQPQSAATQAPSKTTLVEATIVIPKGAKKAAGRKRDYTSPFTGGLVVAVRQSTGSAVATYSITGYDLTTNNATATCSQTGANTACVILFNAPVTSATQSDLFYIYAYDTPQTVGAIGASYAPAGKLLSEDIGTANAGDPVPSGSNGAIVAGATNKVLFVLQPVVATPIASIDGTLAGSTTGLVLSVPGTGGSTPAMYGLHIDGYDADNNEIANNLVAGSGDDVYVNPIKLTISPAATFSLSAAQLTSAAADTDSVTYAPAAGDQPTSETSTPPSATIAISDSLANAGFGDLSSSPASGQAVTVAPLFAFASTATATLFGGFFTHAYAIQAAIPNPQIMPGYTLTPDATVSATNDCSTYTISAASAGTAGTSQQAVFTLSSSSTPATGTTCLLTLSDGISSTDLVFNPDGTHTP